MAYRKEPVKLRIFDDTKQLCLSLYGFKEIESHKEGDVFVVEYDVNQIEMHFRQDDEDFWGAGGGDYLSTRDIRNMSQCIRSVVFGGEKSAEYVCQKDLFRIGLSHDPRNDTYDFTVSMLNLLSRDKHITITKTGLTREALDEYITPFFIWSLYNSPYGNGRLVERFTADGEC